MRKFPDYVISCDYASRYFCYIFLLGCYGDDEVKFIFQALQEGFILNLVYSSYPHLYSGTTRIIFEQPVYKQLY